MTNPSSIPHPEEQKSMSNSRSSSSPIRDDQEVAASPLINSKNHGPASGSMPVLDCSLCGERIKAHHPRWIATVDTVCLDCVQTLVNDALLRRVDARRAGKEITVDRDDAPHWDAPPLREGIYEEPADEGY